MSKSTICRIMKEDALRPWCHHSFRHCPVDLIEPWHGLDSQRFGRDHDMQALGAGEEDLGGALFHPENPCKERQPTLS